MATFEEQKTKYKTVIQVVEDEAVQLANLHQQDGKLFIKGTAPTLDAANKVWDEIKRINPRLDDIVADFPVDPSIAPKPAWPQPQTSGSQTYKVKQGDTLSKISKQFYGDANQYMRIFNA